MQFKTTALYLALAAAPLTSALGINCRGSAGCSAGTDPNTSKMLRDKLNAVPDRTFTNGQQIVCVFPKAICAFLQDTNGPKTTAQIRVWAQQIVDHGCNVCGSVATEPGNDVSKGQLTFNYIDNAQPLYN